MMRPLSRREMIAATGALALLVGCGGGEPRFVGPKPIAIGLDECAWCRMLIDEEGFVAQYVAANGRAFPFGEVGCLLAWMAANPADAGTPFVRTRDARDWRRAAAAQYATGAERTPMRFDVVAYAGAVPAADGVIAEIWEELRRKRAPHARHG